MFLSKIKFRNFLIRSKVLQLLTFLRENRHFMKKRKKLYPILKDQ
jgi:hypothetical protein